MSEEVVIAVKILVRKNHKNDLLMQSKQTSEIINNSLFLICTSTTEKKQFKSVFCRLKKMKKRFADLFFALHRMMSAVKSPSNYKYNQLIISTCIMLSYSDVNKCNVCFNIKQKQLYRITYVDTSRAIAFFNYLTN